MSDRLLNLAEMAEYLGVSVRTLSKHLDAIPHVRVGKSLRFDRVKVLAALEVRRGFTTPKPAPPKAKARSVQSKPGRFAGVLS